MNQNLGFDVGLTEVILWSDKAMTYWILHLLNTPEVNLICSRHSFAGNALSIAFVFVILHFLPHFQPQKSKGDTSILSPGPSGLPTL